MAGQSTCLRCAKRQTPGSNYCRRCGLAVRSEPSRADSFRGEPFRASPAFEPSARIVSAPTLNYRSTRAARRQKPAKAAKPPKAGGGFRGVWLLVLLGIGGVKFLSHTASPPPPPLMTVPKMKLPPTPSWPGTTSPPHPGVATWDQRKIDEIIGRERGPSVTDLDPIAPDVTSHPMSHERNPPGSTDRWPGERTQPSPPRSTGSDGRRTEEPHRPGTWR